MGIISACDSSVQPVETRTNEYTIYGVINLNKERNYIRIRNVNTPLNPESTKEFDATVLLTDLNSGQSREMLDSMIVYDEITTHNFYRPEDFQESTPYLLQVSKNGEVVTEARTDTPARAELRSVPSLPNCASSVTVSFDPVREDEFIVLEIGFDIGRRYYYRVFLASDAEGDFPESYTFNIQRILELIRSMNNIPDDDNLIECHELSSDLMYYSYTHYGAEFIQDTRLGDIEIAGDYKRFGAFYDSLVAVPIDTTDLSPDL